jgi:hypothetical protein
MIETDNDLTADLDAMDRDHLPRVMLLRQGGSVKIAHANPALAEWLGAPPGTLDSLDASEVLPGGLPPLSAPVGGIVGDGPIPLTVGIETQRDALALIYMHHADARGDWLVVTLLDRAHDAEALAARDSELAELRAAQQRAAVRMTPWYIVGGIVVAAAMTGAQWAGLDTTALSLILGCLLTLVRSTNSEATGARTAPSEA